VPLVFWTGIPELNEPAILRGIDVISSHRKLYIARFYTRWNFERNTNGVTRVAVQRKPAEPQSMRWYDLTPASQKRLARMIGTAKPDSTVHRTGVDSEMYIFPGG
jgi:hypothetical protein